jgi:hypothetical protein
MDNSEEKQDAPAGGAGASCLTSGRTIRPAQEAIPRESPITWPCFLCALGLTGDSSVPSKRPQRPSSLRQKGSQLRNCRCRGAARGGGRQGRYCCRQVPKDLLSRTTRIESSHVPGPTDARNAEIKGRRQQCPEMLRIVLLCPGFPPQHTKERDLPPSTIGSSRCEPERIGDRFGALRSWFTGQNNSTQAVPVLNRERDCELGTVLEHPGFAV